MAMARRRRFIAVLANEWLESINLAEGEVLACS
jgi:hypothetical protein